MDRHDTPIPIKNLFYMLCYAWNVLAISDDISVGSDDYDDAYNLLASLFSPSKTENFRFSRANPVTNVSSFSIDSKP